ncbi:HPP family protein [Candidatus Bipolaricaulota bacterium]
MRIVDEKFRQQPLRFLAQSFLAFAAVAIIAVYLGALTNGAVVVALGASAFIVFATPEHDTAQPRRLLGGHAICIAIGLLCSIPFRLSLLPKTSTSVGLIAAAAVGLAILAMTVTDTEHPPAAGNALAFAISSRGTDHVLFIVAAVACLGLVHRLLRKWLRDLT